MRVIDGSMFIKHDLKTRAIDGMIIKHDLH